MAAARAAADSLVYVAGGQVQVVDADGSQSRAVSPQGDWAWPSESDNGTKAMDRRGKGGRTPATERFEV